jgi:uncharacterized RDD family membrane protein YckC
MYCIDCGKQLPDGASFCPFCGRGVPPGVAGQPESGRDKKHRLRADLTPGAEAVEPVSGQASQSAGKVAAAYAGWWQRWLAHSIIDGVVACGLDALVWAAFFLGVWLGHVRSGGEGDPELTAPVVVLVNVYLILFLLVPFVYYWVSNSLGKSVGKAIVGIQVVRKDDGMPPGFELGFVRTLGYIVSAIPLNLGYLWAAWDEDRQAWHDKVVGTIVVKVR